jgi:hypothetical protein
MDTEGNVLGRVKDMIEPDEMLEIVHPAATRISAPSAQK